MELSLGPDERCFQNEPSYKANNSQNDQWPQEVQGL